MPMTDVASPILSFFTAGPAVYLVAFFIVLLAWHRYWFWFRPAKKAVIRDLNLLSTTIQGSSQSWEVLRQNVRKTISPDSRAAETWLETEGRVIKVLVVSRPEYVMYGLPRDLWSAPTLLSRCFNMGLAEAVPNILVGIGLFFTFGFLSLALIGTTAALTEASTSKATEAAISQLLQIAGSKFLTSLAGLGASKLLTAS